TIQGGLPTLIVGAPGVGKSDLVAQAAKAANADLIISHPAVSDPTDAKGLPWPGKDGEHATFLPFGELAQALKATSRTVWFLDDLGQATAAVQASFMQLILARRVNGHLLPDAVTFVAATNRRGDKAGVNGILEPVKSRFKSIVELAPALEDWCHWAINAGVPAELIAFLRFRPELLHSFIPSADMENTPSPRTWHAVSDLMTKTKLAQHTALLFPAVAGAVGEGAAIEFVSFLKTFRNLVSPDAILMAPDSAAIPEEPSALYAVSGALAHRATEANFDRVIKYLSRLKAAGFEEFAAYCFQDALTKTPAIANSPAFHIAVSGEFASLISGGIDQ
ncbi:MAG: AAA family ATPase, partial [Georgfuchsia sp.]